MYSSDSGSSWSRGDETHEGSNLKDKQKKEIQGEIKISRDKSKDRKNQEKRKKPHRKNNKQKDTKEKQKEEETPEKTEPLNEEGHTKENLGKQKKDRKSKNQDGNIQKKSNAEIPLKEEENPPNQEEQYQDKEGKVVEKNRNPPKNEVAVKARIWRPCRPGAHEKEQEDVSKQNQGKEKIKKQKGKKSRSKVRNQPAKENGEQDPKKLETDPEDPKPTHEDPELALGDLEPVLPAPVLFLDTPEELNIEPVHEITFNYTKDETAKKDEVFLKEESGKENERIMNEMKVTQYWPQLAAASKLKGSVSSLLQFFRHTLQYIVYIQHTLYLPVLCNILYILYFLHTYTLYIRCNI